MQLLWAHLERQIQLTAAMSELTAALDEMEKMAAALPEAPSAPEGPTEEVRRQRAEHLHLHLHYS